MAHRRLLNSKALVLLQAAVIALATGWVFFPAIHGGWVWDDLAEIVGNPVLRDSAGLRKIWFAPAGADYFPLKTTAQWVEWHLWAENATAYHLVNVGLHLLSAFLLWHLLRKLGVRCAWLGGLFFAIHPLTVESVAWISEFKNTLSLPLLLLAFIAWLEFDERQPRHLATESTKSTENTMNGISLCSLCSLWPKVWNWYGLSLLCFLAAMLSKSSVVMFPAVILLYCWWKRGRVGRRDLAASAPFFAVSLVLGLVTVAFQQQRAIGGADLATGGFLSRCAGAGLAVFFYLWKCVFPVGLVPNYPPWHLNPPTLWEFWPWVVIGAVFFGLFLIPIPEFFGRKEAQKTQKGFEPEYPLAAATRAMPRELLPPKHLEIGCRVMRFLRLFAANKRSVVFGLGWFFLFLLPILGFVPMAYQRISWVADHFAYVSLVGLAGLAAAAISNSEIRIPKFGSIVIAALLAALAIQSHRYARVFRSDAALWTYTLEHNPDSWTAHNDLGMSLAQSGRLPQAIAHYEAALRLKPDYAAARVNLGNALVGSNRLPDALAQYEAALRVEPRNREARTDLGNALAQSGQFPEAIGQYEQALRLRPDDLETRHDLAYAHYKWGNALGNSGQVPEAVDQYREALRLMPDYAEAHANLGLALAGTGRSQEAILQLKEALRLKPAYAEAQAYLGFALAGAGRFSEAIGYYEQALRLNPADADVHYNLAVALRQAGRLREANAHFKEAARLEGSKP